MNKFQSKISSPTIKLSSDAVLLASSSSSSRSQLDSPSRAAIESMNCKAARRFRWRFLRRSPNEAGPPVSVCSSSDVPQIGCESPSRYQPQGHYQLSEIGETRSFQTIARCVGYEAMFSSGFTARTFSSWSNEISFNSCSASLSSCLATDANTLMDSRTPVPPMVNNMKPYSSITS